MWLCSSSMWLVRSSVWLASSSTCFTSSSTPPCRALQSCYCLMQATQLLHAQHGSSSSSTTTTTVHVTLFTAAAVGSSSSGSSTIHCVVVPGLQLRNQLQHQSPLPPAPHPQHRHGPQRPDQVGRRQVSGSSSQPGHEGPGCSKGARMSDWEVCQGPEDVTCLWAVQLGLV